MKKAVIFLMGLLLAVIAGFGPMIRSSAARADTGADHAVKHIVMWKFKSNKEDYIIYDWVKQWNERHPGIQVNLELIPFTDYLDNKLPTAFATNSAPDVYQISAGSFLKYARAGCTLPLDSYLKPALKADFYQSGLDRVSYRGKIMGIPIEREPVALFYNKRVFADKGLAPPRTWDELAHCAQALNSETMSGIYVPVLPTDYQNFIFYSFLAQISDGVTNANSRTACFRAKGYQALELWRNLAKYNYKFETVNQSPNDIYALASGKTAMQVCGYWAVQTLTKYYPKLEYGAVPLPVGPGGRRRSVYGGWFQVVNPRSKYKNEAAAFILWMWGGDVSRPSQWCTEASTKFPARISVMKYDAKMFDNKTGIIFKNEIMPFAVPEYRYPAEISNAVSKAVQNAMFTDEPIQSIAAKADEEINNYLKSSPEEFK